VLDAITAVFEFRSLTYRRLREGIWLDVFASAAREDISSSSPSCPRRAWRRASPSGHASEAGGGRLRLIELTCDDAEQEARLDAPTRAAWAQLRSVEDMRDLRARGWLDYAMPAPELTLDTGETAPEAAARRIAEFLGLGATPKA
jgi:hypothetical protein